MLSLSPLSSGTRTITNKPSRNLGVSVLLVALVALFSGSGLAGQSTSPGMRAISSGMRAGLVTQAVNDGERVVLEGNVHPLATRAADRGAVPEQLPAERMMLLFGRSMEQEMALRGLIESLHDRNSPNFHKWLTPQQFGAEWGATDSDIAAVTAWLESHGFRVEGASAGRTTIEFSGTVGQVNEAFHTSIHSYMVNGELHHANATDPEIPAALAPLVAAVVSMNDFPLQSTAKPGPRGVYDMSTHRATPEYTTSTPTFVRHLYVGPGDAAVIYNSPNPALNPSYSGATIDGTGASIGIIGNANVSLSQIANYRKLFGLSSTLPSVVLDGNKDPGVNANSVQAYLDLEVASALAPGAQTYLYTSASTALDTGLDLATVRAVNDDRVDVLSISFTNCEKHMGGANQFFSHLWEQAAAQGMSVTAATGDTGSAGCDDPGKENQVTGGLQVSGIASTPFDIAVGGTDFSGLAGPDGKGANFPTYASTSNTPGTLTSAKGYIPESVWNDSVSNFPPGLLTNNVPASPAFANIVAGGGGKSTCSNNSLDGSGNVKCISGYPKPAWQSANGVPADGARDIPDVAVFGGNGLFFASWGICTDQDKDSSGNAIADCTPGSNGLPATQFYIYGAGGTSASAPAFAGMLALVREATGDRVGQADYVLYGLARNAPSVFHDVTAGNNSVPCVAASPNCETNAAGKNFLNGANAGAGYDLATGLGSVDIGALITNWTNAGLGTSTIQFTLSPTTLIHGQTVTVDATVTSGIETPTGDAALVGSPNPPSVPLSRGIAFFKLYPKSTGIADTGQLKLNYMPGGTYDVTAHYGGDAVLKQEVSPPIRVSIAAESSTTPVTMTVTDPGTGQPALGGVTPYGFFYGFRAEPYGNSSPIVGGVVQKNGSATGEVTFSFGSATLSTANLGIGGYTISNLNLPPGGTHNLVAAYGGDVSFLPSEGLIPLTVTPAVTQIVMTKSATGDPANPYVFNIALTADSAGVAPGGTVALVSGTKTLAQGPMVGVGATPGVLASGSASIAIPSAALAVGSDQIQAVYLGDGNYGKSFSNVIAVTKSSFSIADIFIELHSEHGTGAGDVVTVAQPGYSGTLNYTCALVTASTSTAPPQCALDPATATIPDGGTIQPLILIFGNGTKLPKGIMVGKTTPLLGASGAILACCCLLFGIPARRKGWRAMLAAILLLAAVGGFTACSTQGKLVAAGTYVFTVTATDAADSSNTASATVTVKVP